MDAALTKGIQMLALGLLLIVIAIIFITAVLFGANSGPVGFDLQVLEIETTAIGVFGLGALTLLVLMFGLLAIRLGTRKSLEHRRERKELKELHAREEKHAGSSSDAGRGTRTDDRATGGSHTDGRTADLPDQRTDRR
ncbi:MAG: hypothetical protein Q8Q02_10145 [Nocardioides sp.]|nr:hypothetical protein [Nocardioides sp.]